MSKFVSNPREGGPLIFEKTKVVVDTLNSTRSGIVSLLRSSDVMSQVEVEFIVDTMIYFVILLVGITISQKILTCCSSSSPSEKRRKKKRSRRRRNAIHNNGRRRGAGGGENESATTAKLLNINYNDNIFFTAFASEVKIIQIVKYLSRNTCIPLGFVPRSTIIPRIRGTLNISDRRRLGRSLINVLLVHGTRTSTIAPKESVGSKSSVFHSCARS